MDVATKIRRQRRAKGLTVRELGRVIGVSGSAVSQWESGGNIKWENRLALGKALDIPITDFLPKGELQREISIRDPQEVLLIDRFRRVPPKLREAYLGILIVQGESQDGEDPKG